MVLERHHHHRVIDPLPSHTSVLDWLGTDEAFVFAQRLARSDRNMDASEIVSTAFLAVSGRREPLIAVDIAAAGRQQLRYAQKTLWRSKQRDANPPTLAVTPPDHPDAADEAFCYGIDPLYDAFREQLRAARHDRDGESLAVALTMCSLALNEGLAPRSRGGAGYGMQSEHDIAVATAVVDPRLDIEGPMPPSLRKVRQRLMDRARTNLLGALEASGTLEEAA